MSTSVVPSGRTDRVNILYDVENGLSEGNYEKAYTEGYLFSSWTPQFLTTEYSVSYSLPEDIYGALIASFVSLNPNTTACQRACSLNDSESRFIEFLICRSWPSWWSLLHPNYSSGDAATTAP